VPLAFSRYRKNIILRFKCKNIQKHFNASIIVTAESLNESKHALIL